MTLAPFLGKIKIQFIIPQKAALWNNFMEKEQKNCLRLLFLPDCMEICPLFLRKGRKQAKKIVQDEEKMKKEKKRPKERLQP